MPRWRVAQGRRKTYPYRQAVMLEAGTPLAETCLWMTGIVIPAKAGFPD